MKDITTYKIAYVLSDLKRVGPTNQTLNIIKNSEYRNNSLVITLFEEPFDSILNKYIINNIKIVSLKLNRKTFMFFGKRKLLKTLKKYNIELVHTSGIKADCISQCVCRKINIPHVITLRNFPKEDILTRMSKIKGYIALYNHVKCLKKCKNLVTCSKTVATKMKKEYPNIQLSTIQNGVDIGKYYAISIEERENLRRKNNFKTNSIIYISTNSFIKRKRIEETITCFLSCCKKNDVLILLGTGELYAQIKEKYNNKRNIKFLGKVSNVNEYLQMSNYFISSSESEGLPNSVLEAISCGIPVLLSDIPEHCEILNCIDTVGKTYELGNIDSFKKIYNYSFSNSSEIRNKLYNSDLTMEKMSNKYVQLYKKILERD